MPLGDYLIEGSKDDSFNKLEKAYQNYNQNLTGLENFRVYQKRQQGLGKNMWDGAGHGILSAIESTANLPTDLAGEKERFFTFSDAMPENKESFASTMTSDIFQFATGLLFGGPIKKIGQAGLKRLARRRRKPDTPAELASKKGGKKRALSKSDFWRITKEGAVTGAITEFIAFRGQDEGLILSRFFETYPEMQDHFEHATSDPDWVNQPTAVTAEKMQSRFEQASTNVMGRAAFAAEGAVIGAVFNHIVALGKAAIGKARGKDARTTKAGKGEDVKGAEAADRQAAPRPADDVAETGPEDEAFKGNTEVKQTRRKLSEALTDAEEMSSLEQKTAREALEPDSKANPIDEDEIADNGEIEDWATRRSDNFEHDPVAHDADVDVRFYDEPSPTKVPVDFANAASIVGRWITLAIRRGKAETFGELQEGVKAFDEETKEILNWMADGSNDALDASFAEDFLARHELKGESAKALEDVKKAIGVFGFKNAEIFSLMRVDDLDGGTRDHLIDFLQKVGKAVNDPTLSKEELIANIQGAAQHHIFDASPEGVFNKELDDIQFEEQDLGDPLGLNVEGDPSLTPRGNEFLANIEDVADTLVDKIRINPAKFDSPKSLSSSHTSGAFLKNPLIMVSRLNAQQYWDKWQPTKSYHAFDGVSETALPKDVFNDYDDFERFLVELERAKLQFPLKGAKGKVRAFKRAVRAAKRQGIGDFYKYEFKAPKHLKHLELTPTQQARVLMDDAVNPDGTVKPERLKEFKNLVSELNGTAKSAKSIHQIFDEAIQILRPDTSFSDVGMKYFSGRMFSFFYQNLKTNINKMSDAETFAKATEMQSNPRGLKEALEEHFLNNADDMAEAYQMDSISLANRIAKGRGDFSHYYDEISVDEKLGYIGEQDVAAMKEMNIRILAYRMEQAISMKNFKQLTEEIDKLSEDQLMRDPDLIKKYQTELERQNIRIRRMQKLRQASGRVLRSWRGIQDEITSSMDSLGDLTKHMGGAKGIKKHAARAGAIFRATEGKAMDKAAAATDYLGKTSSAIDVHNEYWINSILSGTKTQLVNMISTGLHMYYKPVEGMFGTVLRDGEDLKLARKQLASTLMHTAAINMQVIRAMGALGLQNIRHLGGLIDKEGFIKKQTEFYKQGQEEGMYAQGIQAVAGAKKSWKTGRGTLSEGADLFDVEPPKAISGENLLSGSASKKAKATVDYIGNIIRIPSRFMIGTDELFKQISFRANVMGRLAGEGAEAGLEGPELAQYIADGFSGIIRYSGRRHTKQAIREEGFRKYEDMRNDPSNDVVRNFRNKEDFVDHYAAENFDADASELSQLGMDWAEDVTFTRALDKDLVALQDAGKISKNRTTWQKDIQDTVHRHPWMRLIMPFIRTPVNILKFPIQRLPFFPMSPRGKVLGIKEYEWAKNLHMRYQADMASNDPIKKAEAHGRVSAGNFYWAAFMMAASSEMITGGGPSNPRERQNKMATGWRPYSFVVGDTYISYARLDPFATVLGLAADVWEKFALLARDGDIEENWFQGVMQAGAYSISNNIADKSYLAGINNVLQAFIEPETQLKPLLKRQLTAYVPKVISQWTPLTDDHYMKKTYGLLDGVASRVPTLASGIEPMRNYLGEPLEAMYEPSVWAAGFNPFLISRKKNDPILDELASLEYGFGAPTPRINGLRHLDMRRFYDDKGRSAYDFFQEEVGKIKLNGKTLRQSLTRLFESDAYKRAATFDAEGTLQFSGTHRDERVKAVKAVMAHYRKQARNNTKAAYPELLKAYVAFKQQQAEQTRRIMGL